MKGKSPIVLGMISLFLIVVGFIFSLVGWFFVDSSIIRYGLFSNLWIFLIYFILLILSFIIIILSIKNNKLWQAIMGLFLSLLYLLMAVFISIGRIVFNT